MADVVYDGYFYGLLEEKYMLMAGIGFKYTRNYCKDSVHESYSEWVFFRATDRFEKGRQVQKAA